MQFQGIENVWVRERREAMDFANKCRTEQRMDVDQFQHLGNFLNSFSTPFSRKDEVYAAKTNSKTSLKRQYLYSIRNSGLVFVYFGSVPRRTHLRTRFSLALVCAFNWSQWKCHVREANGEHILLCLFRRSHWRLCVCMRLYVPPISFALSSSLYYVLF